MIAASTPITVDRNTSITWIYVGNSSQLFGFSTNTMGFYEARSACADLGSNVTLACLDKYFYDVQQYVYIFRKDHEFWVDATRPNSGKYHYCISIGVKLV